MCVCVCVCVYIYKQASLPWGKVGSNPLLPSEHITKARTD